MSARDVSPSPVRPLICTDPSQYSVSVTAQSRSATWPANTAGHTAAFTVHNGPCADTYDFTYSLGGQITSVTLDKTSQALAANLSTTVTATYSVGAVGTGYVSVTATGRVGGATGADQQNVTVVPQYQVSVTPKATSVTANSGMANSQVFAVNNTGAADATFNLTTTCTRVATNCQAPPTVSVTHSTSQNVTVTYQAGVNDTGTVKLVASFGGASDSGWVKVTAPLFMTVSVAFNNNDNQKLTLCANGCFAPTAAVSTPPYYSLGTARNVTLAYHGDRVSMRPFIYADVSLSGGAPAVQEYWLQLQDSNGVFLPFLNGDQNKIRFSGATPAPVRLAGQVDASAYVRTGAYRFTVVVSTVFSDHTEQIATSVKLLLENERQSPVARGWMIAGVPRLYVQGDNSAVITKGDGSGSYFSSALNSRGTGAEFSYLTKVGTTYLWEFPDSTKAWFGSAGLADSLIDRYGNAVRFEYDGSSRLVKIYDPIRTYNAGASRSYIALQYNASGYGLAQIQEPSPVDGSPTGGRITSFTVAADSTLQSVSDPARGTTSFGYDVARRLQSVTDRRGGVWTYTYATDSSWKLKQVTDPQVPIDAGGGNTILTTPTINYSAWQTVGVPTGSTAINAYPPVRPDSVKAQVTDPGGHVTTYTVDRWGQPLTIVEPLGRTTVTTRSGALAVRVVYPTGVKDSAMYNGDGLLVYWQPAGRSATSISYGAYAQPNQISGALFATQTLYIGAHGHVDSTKINGASRTVYYTDARGRDTLVVDPLFHKTWTHYDARFGNLDSTVVLDNVGARVGFVGTRFDGYGRDSIHLRSIQPADTVVYDVLNRVRRTASGSDGSSMVYGYDSLFLVRVQDQKGQVYRSDYNPLGWVTRRYDPADTVNLFVSYRYNLDGLGTSITNRRGQRVDLGYDPLHRVVSKTGANVMSDSVAYDTVGRRMVGWNSVSRDSIFRSPSGWTDSVVTILAGQRFRRFYRPWSVGGDTRFQLDSLGISTTTSIAFLARRNFWNGTTGLLDSLRINGRALTFHYNGELLSDTTTFPTGLKRATTYTTLHQFGQVSFSSAAVGSFLNRSYTYDSLGRVLKDSEPAGATTRLFAYDGRGRLGRFEFDQSFFPPLVSGFGYDSAGNMRTSTLGSTTTTGTYLTGDRESSWGALNYTYDTDGNRITQTGGGRNVTYHWTADGRMDTVTAGTVKLVYDYNAFGQLVRRSRNGVVERHFLWDQGQLLAELDANATGRVAEYAYFRGADNPAAFVAGADTGSVHYYQKDAQGNVIGVFSDTVQQRFLYRPWGDLDSANSAMGTLGETSRLRWKGLMWEGDSTQLYYVRARWYDPQSHRFMTEDPLGLTGGINPYLFAGNDPVNGRDPSGLLCLDFWSVEWYVDTGEIVPGSVQFLYEICLSGNGSGSRAGGNPSSKPKGLCTATTLVGTIKVDASTAGEAIALVNSAVMSGGTFNNSFRTSDQQAYLWLSWKIGPPLFGVQRLPAAFPGTSCHEAGFCIDINFSSRTQYNAYVGGVMFQLFGGGFTNSPSDWVHYESDQWSRMSAADREQAINQAQAANESGNIPACSAPL